MDVNERALAAPRRLLGKNYPATLRSHNGNMNMNNMTHMHNMNTFYKGMKAS